VADLILARHIVEHAEAPWQFMQALTNLLVPDGLLVIEVPDCSANIARQDYTMVWEEHALYLTADSVLQLLPPCGCFSLALEIHPFPFEDVIVLYARKSDGSAKALAVDSAARDRNVAVARSFAHSFDVWSGRYRRVFADLTKDGRRLAGYGAGHLTCAFLNFHDVADFFSFVVDDTPRKQGLFLPESGLPVVARERLSANEIGACLFGLTPELEDRIIAKNSHYASGGGQFFSMCVDSPRSIRKLAASLPY
jgi:hypothetical protein